MTQDEIIEMWNSVIKYAPSEVRIAEFAHLVAAKEREACVELRNMFHPIDGHGRKEMIDAMNRGLDEYQAAIRARGEQA
jgi:hypothetical protein